MKSLQKWKQLLCSVRNQPNVRVMSMSSETCSEENGTSNLFDDIVLKRHFTHEFNPGRNIDRLLMKKLITLSQSAPSSFNLQPFKIIVVDNESVKEVLAESMIGLNSVRVRTAPVTVVYLSDKGR